MTEHTTTVTVVYTSGDVKWHYEVRCSKCGLLGTMYTRKEAENRKSTHDREQDAGAD